jgi:hypothetical protein
MDLDEEKTISSMPETTWPCELVMPPAELARVCALLALSNSAMTFRCNSNAQTVELAASNAGANACVKFENDGGPASVSIQARDSVDDDDTAPPVLDFVQTLSLDYLKRMCKAAPLSSTVVVFARDDAPLSKKLIYYNHNLRPLIISSLSYNRSPIYTHASWLVDILSSAKIDGRRVVN